MEDFRPEFQVCLEISRCIWLYMVPNIPIPRIDTPRGISRLRFLAEFIGVDRKRNRCLNRAEFKRIVVALSSFTCENGPQR